jgi:hypothetical protein
MSGLYNATAAGVAMPVLEKKYAAQTSSTGTLASLDRLGYPELG